MASSRRTKIRIAATVLLAWGFWDAVAGRIVWQPGAGKGSPPPPDPDPLADRRGAVHAHSTYSDGAGDMDAVMAGAVEAGVDWLLMADHNTQQPRRDGWEGKYNSRPLLLIGTEVTVERGTFLLALDMPPDWEPARDKAPQTMIDEINARGGLPLVSLPFDVKHPWQDWDATGYAGLEVMNFSTIARRHINIPSLVWLLTLHRLRGMGAVLAAIPTRPDQALARWDGLTRGGAAQVGVGALDAHALLKVGKRKYALPSYADSFRAAHTHAFVPPDLTGDSLRRALYDSLRAGRCYFSYDILGDPTGATFTARTATAQATMGERINRAGGDITFAAHAPGDRTLLQLRRGGRVVASARNGNLEFTTSEAGTYRVEAYRYAFRVGPFYLGARPWIFTNPLYVDE